MKLCDTTHHVCVPYLLTPMRTESATALSVTRDDGALASSSSPRGVSGAGAEARIRAAAKLTCSRWSREP